MRLVSAAFLAALAVGANPAAAADPQCRVIDVDLQPSDKLQIVAWLEDASGRQKNASDDDWLKGCERLESSRLRNCSVGKVIPCLCDHTGNVVVRRPYGQRGPLLKS